MAHSLSAGSSFGFFDIFIAMTVMLSIVVLMCEGLPTLRRCCQKVFAQVGITSGQERCELHLNSRGQRNYLIYWILIVVFHVGLFAIFSDVHVHHYWVGLVVGSCCIFQSPLSRLLLLKSVMMTIEGIGVWGADAIVGEDDGGMTEGDGNYRLAFVCAGDLSIYVSSWLQLVQRSSHEDVGGWDEYTLQPRATGGTGHRIKVRKV